MKRIAALITALFWATLAAAQVTTNPSITGVGAGGCGPTGTTACQGTTITATTALSVNSTAFFRYDTGSHGTFGLFSAATGDTAFVRFLSGAGVGSVILPSGGNVSFASSTSNLFGESDTFITRAAAAILAITGDGTGTASGQAGWLIGNSAATTNSKIWASTAVGANDFRLLANSTSLTLNINTGGLLVFNTGGNSVTKFSLSSVAGDGPAITAGTAATASMFATSWTQTRNYSAAATDYLSATFTTTGGGTATHASDNLLNFKTGGSGAETSKFSVSLAGMVTGASNALFNNNITSTAGYLDLLGTGGAVYFSSNSSVGAVFGASAATNISWISNGLVGVGTGTQGSFAGSIKLTGLEAVGTAVVLSGLGSSTGTPSSLCLNGTTVTVNAALTCTVSSERYKDDILPFNGSALKLVSAIEPSTFFYKDRLDRPRIGMIAEQLASVDKRLAEWDADGRANSIDFPAVMGVLVKAVQELDRRTSN